MLKNKGSAVVEVTLILPFFIFGMLSIYHMGQAKLAEQIIYEAAVETAEYLAEEAYLEIYNPLTPYVKFKQYIDDEDVVERYIQNGVSGIIISGYTEPDCNNQITITICYKTSIKIPFISGLTSTRIYEITQRGYIGDKELADGNDEQDNQYVFVTDNRDVYHTSRECSHLLLTIRSTSLQEAQTTYSPCEFCGKDTTGANVFVTEDGNRYHCSINCSGLKRTVYRVKKKSVGGLPECSRCAN